MGQAGLANGGPQQAKDFSSKISSEIIQNSLPPHDLTSSGAGQLLSKDRGGAGHHPTNATQLMEFIAQDSSLDKQKHSVLRSISMSSNSDVVHAGKLESIKQRTKNGPSHSAQREVVNLKTNIKVRMRNDE